MELALAGEPHPRARVSCSGHGELLPQRSHWEGTSEGRDKVSQEITGVT